MDCSTPGFPVHHQLLELTQTHVRRVGDAIQYLILCCLLLLLPSIFPSTRVFSNESVLCIRWPKYGSFSFSISPSNIIRPDFLWDWLVWSPYCTRVSQESSPAPRFKSINSLALSLLYGSKDVKAMTNLDSILKSRDIALLTKAHIVKAMIFPVVRYGCESWTRMKAECWKTDAFNFWCWRRFLRVPWTVRRSNQSTLVEINPEYSLERLMLKLKL